MSGFQLRADIQHTAIARRVNIPEKYTFTQLEKTMRLIFEMAPLLTIDRFHFFSPATKSVIAPKNSLAGLRLKHGPQAKFLQASARIATHLNDHELQLIYEIENGEDIVINLRLARKLPDFDSEFPVVTAKDNNLATTTPLSKIQLNQKIEEEFSTAEKFVTLRRENAKKVATQQKFFAKFKAGSSTSPISLVTITIDFTPTNHPDFYDLGTEAAKVLAAEKLNPQLAIHFLVREEYLDPHDHTRLVSKKMDRLANFAVKLTDDYIPKLFFPMPSSKSPVDQISSLLNKLQRYLDKFELYNQIEVRDIELVGEWPVYFASGLSKPMTSAMNQAD